MLKIKKSIYAILVMLIISSCGKNPFKSYDKEDAAIDATLELENNNPDKAIDILLSELGDQYTAVYEGIDDDSDLTTSQAALTSELIILVDAGATDAPNLVSILASAKAQLHGIDPFKIALEFASISTSEESESSDAADSDESSSAVSGGNELTKLFPVLPDASSENLHGLDLALTVLRSIGTYKTISEEYKEALFLTASIALVTKTLDSDGDGEVSALESITLSDEAAEVLLNQITAAAIAAAAGATEGEEETAKSAKQIQSLQAEIDAQEGDTQEEKLRNFLGNNNQSS